MTIGEGNAESFAFFCMHASSHCACIVFFRPRNAIWSLSKAYQYVFKLRSLEESRSRGAGISLNPSNFSLDKISYTIHISSMVIHLSNKYKNLQNSCWLDLGSFCHSLSGFSILLHKTSKIYFPIYTLFLQKQNFFLKNKSKERHFVNYIQICFFLVYTKEIEKTIKAGPSLSASDYSHGESQERARSPPEPNHVPELLNSWLLSFSWALQDKGSNSLVWFRW